MKQRPGYFLRAQSPMVRVDDSVAGGRQPFLAIAVGSLSILLAAAPAQGEDLTTAFQLPPPSSLPDSALPEQGAAAPQDTPPVASLPIPPIAAEAPIQDPASQAVPLPPPPPLPVPKTVFPAPAVLPPTAPPVAQSPLELSFQLNESSVAAASPLPTQPTAAAIAQGGNQDYTLEGLFEGGAESLVARVVGSAEGTRTPDGHRTVAYYGHRDPGNGVWNLGSFSYQHGAATPEEADTRQLERLRKQAIALQSKAAQAGLDLTLAETLNGIDLANQAPLAALDRGGYIDWLVQARQLQMVGDDAILWSRTRAFLDPDTQQWNAPGLGNTVHRITQDQDRRMRAIAQALTVYQSQLSLAAAEISSDAVQPLSPEDPGVARIFEFDVLR